MKESKKSNILITEFKSVSRGIQVTDSMAKSAKINILQASTLCPGKYLTIVEGEISALNSAEKIAEDEGGRHLFSSSLVSNIDEKVTEAIAGKLIDPGSEAIGIIEGPQMADLVNSSDIAIDSAPVEFIEYRLARGCGVASFYVMTGELSALTEAASNAARYLKSRGSLLAYKIIPGPDKQVLRWMKSSLCSC
jgi:microcompartment protein CcmL/EutN